MCTSYIVIIKLGLRFLNFFGLKYIGRVYKNILTILVCNKLQLVTNDVNYLSLWTIILEFSTPVVWNKTLFFGQVSNKLCVVVPNNVHTPLMSLAPFCLKFQFWLILSLLTILALRPLGWVWIYSGITHCMPPAAPQYSNSSVIQCILCTKLWRSQCLCYQHLSLPK